MKFYAKSGRRLTGTRATARQGASSRRFYIRSILVIRLARPASLATQEAPTATSKLSPEHCHGSSLSAPSGNTFPV